MLRIALAQINTIVGDLSANKKKIISYLARAGRKGAHLTVFPEMTLTGYPPEDLLLKPRFVERNREILNDLAGRIKKPWAVVGFVNQEKGKNYNSLAVLGDEKIQAVYNKIHLPNYGVFDEKRYFSNGRDPLVIDLKGLRLHLNICEDLWVPVAKREKKNCINEVDALINISCSPYHLERLNERIALVKRAALQQKTTVLYCNLVGGQDELIFDGGSMVADHNGELKMRGAQFREDLLFYDLKGPPKCSPRGERFGIGKLQALPRKKIPPVQDRISEIHDALVLGIKDYMGKNGFKTAVIGSSGGIDSAVVSALSVEALGQDHVKTVTMPSRFSSKGTYQDALKLAECLDVECIELPIHDLYQAYLSSLKEQFKGRAFDHTEENIQARIRGNLLMALSNKYGWLVLTTGNKSEMSVGYSTIYGDMAGGFSVIKDLYKTQVYRLAGYINRKTEIIPSGIILRPPSAELAPGQTDQDSLPPYDLLDRILEQYIEQDRTFEEIVEQGLDRKTVRRVVRLVDVNEYKRRQSAVGIRITPKAFGKDRRMPIVNHFI